MTRPRDVGPSTTLHDPVVEATHRLARVLDRFGDALVAVDAAAMLTVEAELGGAIAAMRAVAHVGDRAAARAAAGQALAALLRCRRLGVSFSGIAAALGQVCGAGAGGYNRAGGYVGRAVRASVLVRV